jgi:hypothetical protein
LSGGRILGQNPDKYLKSLPPCLSRSPLQVCLEQRWASTLTSRWNADTYLIPDLRSIERSERTYFFEKPKGKIMPSSAIFVDRWRSRSLGIDFYTFSEKKTLSPIPQLFHRSKLVSVNLPILPFFKFKIRKFLQALMPTCASGGWRCDLCLSEREKLPRGGGGEKLPVFIENFMEHVSWTVPTLRQRFRNHTLRNFLPKLKIMDKDIDLALYCDLCRSLSITISRDCFNVKNIAPYTSTFPKA